MTRQQDDQRAAVACTAALAEEIQAELAAIGGKSDLIQRRGRLMRITTKLDTSRLPADTQLRLRAALNQQNTALAAAETAQAQAREVTERQRRAAEAQAAEEARQVAARETRERQAAEQLRQAEAGTITRREAATTERYFIERRPNLPPEVSAFLYRNPAVKAPGTKADVVGALGILDSRG